MNGKKILIVEDEAITALELEETLANLGYDVVGTVTGGMEAIRYAKEKYPDLILMDIRLDGSMDGIETAKSIHLFYDIPIIFLTAYSDDRTLARAVETRSSSYLLKPFNERELFSNIEMAINRHRFYKRSVSVQDQSIDTMIDMLAVGVIRTDSQRQVLKINGLAEKMVGVSRDDLIGKNFWDSVPLQSTRKEVLLELLEKSEQGGDATIQWPYPVSFPSVSGKAAQAVLKITMVRMPDDILEEEIYVLTPA